MKLSSISLSTAAILLAGSAFAADLPAKKAAPAAAASGVAACPAYGAGYFQVPGTDECIKLGGFVRSNNTATLSTVARGTAPYSFAGSWQLEVDAKNNTDLGTVSSHIAMRDAANREVYVDFAGLRAGYFPGLSDLNLGGNNDPFNEQRDTGMYYQAALGSSKVYIGMITPVSNSGTTTLVGRPDLQARFDTTAGAVALNFVAVSHEATGSTTGSANGYALLSRAVVDMSPVKVSFYGAYANAASAYLSNGAATTVLDASSDSSSLSSGTDIGAAVEVKVGTGTAKAFGNQISISDSAGTNPYRATNLGVNYTLPIAKGLLVRPELYNSTTSVQSSGSYSTAQTLYVRIQRDF